MGTTTVQAGSRWGNGVNLGFEAKLWAAADALRNNMDAAEYKHVLLGLIFLKYISDAFEAKHAELDAQRKQGADPEDPEEYRAVNIPRGEGEDFVLRGMHSVNLQTSPAAVVSPNGGRAPSQRQPPPEHARASKLPRGEFRSHHRGGST
jgi:hypothetical protein